MTEHLTNGGVFGPLTFSGPNTLILDPFAYIIATGGNHALTLRSGPWTLVINGGVRSENGNAVFLVDPGFKSTLTIGPDADIYSQSGAGVHATHPTNITNTGFISGGFSGITELAGDYTILNLKTGVIRGGSDGLDLGDYTGTHLVKNAGEIAGGVRAITGGSEVDKITNWGVLEGEIELFGGNDIFTNFKKVRDVVVNGIVTGTIRLGDGDDLFNGGNNREVVRDGNGKDTVTFAGGEDVWLGFLKGGSDLVDTIDGGKGKDVYDASLAGANGVIINLDSVSHTDSIYGTIAANRADDINNAATPHDIIFHFEDARGTPGPDAIFGTNGANELIGGDGNDHLYGLGGKDRLSGGADNDIFVYASLKHTGATRATRDTIIDFQVGIDKIDLDAINSKLGNVIHFIGVNANFDGSAGALRAVWSGTQTIVQLDTNGDFKTDFSIALSGFLNIGGGDFLL